jgi:hypothetical protein
MRVTPRTLGIALCWTAAIAAAALRSALGWTWLHVVVFVCVAVAALLSTHEIFR